MNKTMGQFEILKIKDISFIEDKSIDQSNHQRKNQSSHYVALISWTSFAIIRTSRFELGLIFFAYIQAHA